MRLPRTLWGVERLPHGPDESRNHAPGHRGRHAGQGEGGHNLAQASRAGNVSVALENPVLLSQRALHIFLVQGIGERTITTPIMGVFDVIKVSVARGLALVAPEEDGGLSCVLYDIGRF